MVNSRITTVGLIFLALMQMTAGGLAAEYFLYIGTYTEGLSKGIYVARLDGESGKLTMPELAVASPSPCFLAVSPNAKTIYAANEGVGYVSAYDRDPQSGRLTLMNDAPTSSSGPCHVSVAPNGRTLLAANYGGGSVKSFTLAPDGRIREDGSLILHHGSGPNTNRQTSAHAHCAVTDPAGKFVLVCDLGLDAVKIYALGTNGSLTAHGSASVPPGAGARHLVFSQDGRYVYVINEMGCSITQFAWESAGGVLTFVETVSILPPGVKPRDNWTSAELLVHPSGQFIYATVRGADTVDVLRVEPVSGRLTFLQSLAAGGLMPRGLGIDPGGKWLFTGNQKSDQVVQFGINPSTGRILPTGAQWKIGAPVDFKFVEVK